MASYAAAVSVHETLTSTVVDDVTITDPHEEVEIINRGTGELYVVVGGERDDPATLTDPGPGSDNTIVVPAGFAVTVASPGNRGSLVKIVGDGDAYSVQAVTG